MNVMSEIAYRIVLYSDLKYSKKHKIRKSYFLATTKVKASSWVSSKTGAMIRLIMCILH